MKRFMAILIGCLFVFAVGCGGAKAPATETPAADEVTDEAAAGDVGGEVADPAEGAAADEGAVEEGAGDEGAAAEESLE